MRSADFYDRLASVFDAMTDWESRLQYEGPFLQRLFETHGVHSVLDAACGTGGHTLAFADWGLRAAGSDQSSAMIECARAKAQAQNLNVSFVVAGLADLTTHFPGPFDQAQDGPFDAVVCLGNSLPHLLSNAELDAGLAGLMSVLRSGGLLILHNLNYDKRWREQPRFFAVDNDCVDGHEVLVWRFADYHAGTERITFHIAVFEKKDGGWDVDVISTPQRPLFWIDLRRRLSEAGMTDITAYGNLTGELFDLQGSSDLVITATKP
ncbi:MAG: Glycine/sarcosine N-methyltransferase [Anaerolineales bacterium]|nr:Glycine/sarcosine N-methyltransferase [Anaerolineales bacterium]